MKIMAVNVSLPLEFEFKGRAMRSSIFKKPVNGPVAVGKTNLAGDGQANLKVHGGAHKAVYAYSHDHYAWWSKTLGRNDLSFGQFGENLTISGLDEDEIYIGDRLRYTRTRPDLTRSRSRLYSQNQPAPARFQRA